MSEILIKGMEMPKSCETCQLATVSYYYTWCPLTKCFMKRGYSFKNCPLVELPPHGDLIDRDFIKNNGISLNDAPTVIPASEED